MIIKPKQSGYQGRKAHPSHKHVSQRPKPKDAFSVILQTEGVKAMMFEGNDHLHVFVSKEMTEEIRASLPKTAGGRTVVLFERE